MVYNSGMIILFILGLLLGAFAVVFALQNTAVITVTFFSWHLTGSLSLILSLALICGLMIAALLVLPESISNYFKYKKLKRENRKLADELEKQKELTHFAKTTSPTRDDIAKIEDGVIEEHLQ